MISLIRFKEDQVITREEANKLQLPIKERSGRFGMQDGKLCVLTYSWYKLTTDPEVTKELIDGKVVYYDEKKDVISSSNIYYPLPADAPEYVHVNGEYLVDVLPFMEECTLEFSIIRSVRDKQPSEVGLRRILDQVEKKVTELAKMIDDTDNVSFNERCNVHVGGGLIATFNEIGVRESACSDVLSIALNDGWRIIAVCVQPDQRRPDYILGRYNPTLDVEQANMAKRD